jgi:hypothetical protein
MLIFFANFYFVLLTLERVRWLMFYGLFSIFQLQIIVLILMFNVI